MSGGRILVLLLVALSTLGLAAAVSAQPAGPVQAGPASVQQNVGVATIQFSAATFSIAETAGAAVIRVTRTGPNLAGGVTVQFATANGTATAPTNYLDATQTLTFAAGETAKDVPVTIVDDSEAGGNRTVFLTLSDPSAGALVGSVKAAVLTIRDDEQGLQFSAPVYVAKEATPTLSIPRISPTP